MIPQAALRELIAATAVASHVPQLAWGVLRDGVVVDGEHTDTVYRIASMTKSFTAAAVLALRDEGALSLDSRIDQLVPELAALRAPEGSEPITVRHLLQMTSGLASDDPWADRHLDITTDDLDLLLAAGPTFAVRTGDQFEYSNLGFGVLGRIVRRITGVSVQQQIQERFLDPLGMHSTSWTCPAHDRWARPHRVQDGRAVPDHPAPLGDGDIAPMGGLWSTVDDLAKWVTWFDDAHVHPARTARWGLSAASRREMQRMHTYVGITELATHRSPSGYGFGLHLRDDAALGWVVTHSGGLPGYGSNMRWIAGRGVGAIALANVTYAPMTALTLRMLHLLHESGSVPHPIGVVAPMVEDAAHRLVAVLNDWAGPPAVEPAPHLLDELFADNVDLDDAYTRRAAAASETIARHGRLLVERVVATRLTAGEVVLRGAASDAELRLDLQLSPEPTARVQWYSLRG